MSEEHDGSNKTSIHDDKMTQDVNLLEEKMVKRDYNSQHQKENKQGNGANKEKDLKLEYREPLWLRYLLYDILLWCFSVIFDCFFREIRPRGAFKLPRQGPVIFVAAPHANQFVDPMILMQQVKKESGRRISFMIAVKSYRQRVIGFLSRCQLSIPVVRAQDNLKQGSGKIKIDVDKDPLLVKGIGTRFLSECGIRGLFALPQSLGASEIALIISDNELVLKKEFKRSEKIDMLLKRGTTYKVADKVDQKQVYKLVFDHLSHGHCIGIFPEGGSHDRTDLLPLKAGVAIMALGAMANDLKCFVKIIPCGMNYFNAHKFRSRAVIEFGDAIEISPSMLEKYKDPETSREAVRELLDTIMDSLRAVTVTCQDYETLMVVQAARRLYASSFTQFLPLPLVVEMNRRLVRGYEVFKDHDEVKNLKHKILKYNKLLKQISLPDHFVAECDHFGKARMLAVLIFRVTKLVILMSLALPGAILYSPVFLGAKLYSKKKAREALANSIVKIKANDVVATWKILIGMGLSPSIYAIYATVGTWYLARHNLITSYIFSWIALFLTISAITYAALITGEQGLDILKSVRPLYLSITSSRYMKQVKELRNELAEQITAVVNHLGPELYPNDFNLLKRSAGTYDNETVVDSDEEEERLTQALRRRRMNKRNKSKKAFHESSDSVSDLSSDSKRSSTPSDGLSLISSDSSLTDIPFFSDYHLHKNVRNPKVVIDLPSSSHLSTSLYSDYDSSGSDGLKVMHRRSSSGQPIELNFGKLSKGSNLSDKIRDKVREKREQNAA